MTNQNEERYCRENIEFTVKGPIPLFLEEEKKNTSGCAVIDIILSKPEKLGELVFRNYYVASIDLLIQTEKEGQPHAQPGRVRTPASWQVSLQRKVLMPRPHEEEGSHGVFSITATESLVPWDRVSYMRLILRQPSPLWATFKLEELNLFGDMPRLGETGAPPLIIGSQKVLGIVQKQTMKSLMTLIQGEPGRTTSATTPSEASKTHDYRTSGSAPYEIIKLPTT